MRKYLRVQIYLSKQIMQLSLDCYPTNSLTGPVTQKCCLSWQIPTQILYFTLKGKVYPFLYNRECFVKPLSSTYNILRHIFLHPPIFNSHLYSNYTVTSLELVQSSVFLTFITLPMLCFQSFFLPALNIVLSDLIIKYCFSAISLKPWSKPPDSSFYTVPPPFCSYLFHSLSVEIPQKL